MDGNDAGGRGRAGGRPGRVVLITVVVATVLAFCGAGLTSTAGAAAKRGGQTEHHKPFKNVRNNTRPGRTNSRNGVRVAALASTASTALIDGDSVTTDDGITDAGGNPVSLEQWAAEQLGYTVTVVSGATWDSMTAAQFASYQLLVVGDPFCNFTPDSATSNAGTWAPVVMGTAGLGTVAGNRTVIGTDPEFHYLEGGGGATPTDPSNPATAGAEHLVADGLSFAGAVTGATGVYFDTSCSDSGSDISVLNQLTASPANWTEDTAPPCGGSVQQIASNAAFDSGATPLTDSDIEGWGCSDHVAFPQFPDDFDALAVATDTATTPTCGTDPDTGTEACGEAYVLVAGGSVVVTAPNLALSPTTGSDPAGGTHTVTATVTSGSPAAAVNGAVVSFVVSGQNAGVTGTCTTSSDVPDPTCATGADGEVLFTYPDTDGAGTDTIGASVTLDGITEHATAAETWTTGAAATTTTTSLSGGGTTGTSISVPQSTAVTDQATLAGSDVANATGSVTYTVYADPACSVVAGSGGTVTVTGGTVPPSSSVSLPTPGTYYWAASYSGDPGNLASTSTCGTDGEIETVTSTSATLTCALTGTITGPPKQIQVTVQAAAGLSAINVTEDVNDAVSVPSFAPGDTDPVVVTATKTDPTGVSELALNVTDVNGQSLSCDPAQFTVSRTHPQTVRHVAAAEHFATVADHGLTSVTFTVNGVSRTVSPDGGQVVDLDLGALFHGSRNTVTVTGRGPGSADILLKD